MTFLRTVLVVLVVGAVVAGLLGYRTFTENQYLVEQAVEDAFEATEPPRVIVETFNGPVEIVTIPEARVIARVTKQAGGSSLELAEERLDEVEVAMTQTGDTIRITATRPEQLLNLGRLSAAVHVQVPAETVLELRTSNGDVKILGPTGTGTVQTSNGKITVHGAKSDLKLTTNNGNIRCEGGRGQVELRTSNGAIEVKTRDAVVNARTSNGAIRCEGPLTAGDHVLHTSNGGITVSLPGQAQFTVDARTSNGRIGSAFDVQTAGKSSKRRLQGQVGSDPAISLRLETSNGSIKLKRDEAILK